MSWHYLPYYINPVLAQVGFFEVRWYWLMYLIALAVVYLLLRGRLKCKEAGARFFLAQDLGDFLALVFLGMLIGARVGFFLFYDWANLAEVWTTIFWPFVKDEAGVWMFTGFYGMSYHGGLLGAVMGIGAFALWRRLRFWQLADFLITAIPLGYFFGRVGNFLNGELYGRVTTSPLGFYFPRAYWMDGQDLLRHPSQLYEALGEGILLFVIFWPLRNKEFFLRRPGFLSALYIGAYGLVRFLVEFFREPDSYVGYLWGGLSLGQWLSLGMVAAAGILLFVLREGNLDAKED